MFMAGSVDEIHENTQAAVMMLCDPDGSLEEDDVCSTSPSTRGAAKFLGSNRRDGVVFSSG